MHYFAELQPASLPDLPQTLTVCVYAKTRDLILLRSCYADAGETEFRGTKLFIANAKGTSM